MSTVSPSNTEGNLASSWPDKLKVEGRKNDKLAGTLAGRLHPGRYRRVGIELSLHISPAVTEPSELFRCTIHRFSNNRYRLAKS